jgi:hypothetical protein
VFLRIGKNNKIPHRVNDRSVTDWPSNFPHHDLRFAPIEAHSRASQARMRRERGLSRFTLSGGGDLQASPALAEARPRHASSLPARSPRVARPDPSVAVESVRSTMPQDWHTVATPHQWACIGKKATTGRLHFRAAASQASSCRLCRPASASRDDARHSGCRSRPTAIGSVDWWEARNDESSSKTRGSTAARDTGPFHRRWLNRGTGRAT